eukprot:Gb_04163 [translate_table: standard]
METLKSQTEALKRLQREAFSDIMKMRDRLDLIEKRFTHFVSSNKQDGSFGGAKTQLKGEVKAGAAFVIMQDESSRQSCSSLEQAKMKTGVAAKFTFETFFRERDFLITECVAGQNCMSDDDVFLGPLTLGKVLYSANINDYLSLFVAPVGAKGKDAAVILNTLQEQALTEFSGNGPALFRHCEGSAIGATVKGSNLAISAAKYLSAWGGPPPGSWHSISNAGPFCLCTLGQVLFQPSEGMLFAFSGLNRFWPTLHFPSSNSLHWSEIGPFIFSKIRSNQANTVASTSTSVSKYLSMPTTDFEGKGTSTQSVALSAEAEFSESMRIGGWLQMERGDWLQESGRKSLQWAVCLSEFREDCIGWGLSIGQSRKNLFIPDINNEEPYSGSGELPESQMQLEAFLRIHCGRGFILQPGLLYVMNKHAHTPALMLQSSWSL